MVFELLMENQQEQGKITPNYSDESARLSVYLGTLMTQLKSY